MSDATTATKPADQTPAPVHPLRKLREQLETRIEEFSKALPPHIKPDHFISSVLTAVQNNQELLIADRQSLWNACMRSAHDGLLPDGREGAIVIYNTKVKIDGVDKWIKKAQWMPMVFGIIKKIRNSGQIAMITARVVFGGDNYRYWIDDQGEHILYEPCDKPDTNLIQRVFAMARTKDGELLVEPLTAADIEKIRSISRTKDKGPWVEWWEEMAKKSAIRRLSKRLPMSAQLDELVRRDDDLYTIGERPALPAPEAQKPQSIAHAFDSFAEAGPTIDHEAPLAPEDQGSEITAPKSTTAPKKGATELPSPDEDPEGFIAAIKAAAAAAANLGALKAVRDKLVMPVKAKLFPPDADEIEQLLKAREAELSA